MLTVATVLKSGGIYDASWVAKLKKGVTKHLPIEFRFMCLSDINVPSHRMPLEHGWPGWWSKMEAFKLEPPVLYIDLDTLITGDLTDIEAATERDGFTILRDFYRDNGLGSGVMAWTCAMHGVYERFAENPFHYMETLSGRGDQGFLEDILNRNSISLWQNLVPGQVVSYKLHCANGVPPAARMVCLHGKPKFRDMPIGDPVRAAWDAL